MGLITLITGGARSGKTTFALSLALKNYVVRAFIGTAVPLDEEMKNRISCHREQRRGRFRTVEESVHLVEVILELPRDNEVAVVDCLTVWLGNLYHFYREDENLVIARMDDFVKRINQASCDLILVTNVVGWSIVPDNPLGRSFRDAAGTLNRQIAEKADNVYLLCCGIPSALKERPAHE